MKSPTKGLLFLRLAVVALQALCNGPVVLAKSTFGPQERFQYTKSLFVNLFGVGHIIQPSRKGAIGVLGGRDRTNVGVNVPLYDAAGNLLTDADIQLQNAITGEGRGTGQIIRSSIAI
jgi:hypothetical protein